jgi:hypothetical protein
MVFARRKLVREFNDSDGATQCERAKLATIAKRSERQCNIGPRGAGRPACVSPEY